MSGIAITGYALRNERPEAAVLPVYAINLLDNWNTVLPPDGSWHEGMGYMFYGFQPFTLTYYLANTLDNHPYPHPQAGFYQNVTKFLAHMTLPGISKVWTYGDTSWAAVQADSASLLFLSILTEEYRDYLAEYFYDAYIPDLGSRTTIPMDLTMHQDNKSQSLLALPKNRILS